MRKFIFTGICFFIVWTVTAQKEEYKKPSLPIDSSTKTITYTKIFQVNASKDSLYRKGKQWFMLYYKNPTGVIRQDNPQEGTIMGKHQIKILNPVDKNGIQTMRGIVQYTITTNYKDNKVRIVINEINLKGTSYTPIEKWLDTSSSDFTTKNYYYLEQMDKEMKNTVQQFEEYITKPVTVKKSDW